jgi:hypothetical protein
MRRGGAESGSWLLGVGMKRRWFVLGAVLWGIFGLFDLLGKDVALIEVVDADGVRRCLNQPGQVTVIIYSNPAVQERTRGAGKALDSFQGLAGFRSVVLVDLRGSLADWAAGYTVRRMQRDLDQEALRVTPAYRKRGNMKNPRGDLSAVADFKGETCVKLGWVKPRNDLRVLIFDVEGKRHREWTDLKKLEELTQAVSEMMEE